MIHSDNKLKHASQSASKPACNSHTHFTKTRRPTRTADLLNYSHCRPSHLGRAIAESNHSQPTESRPKGETVSQQLSSSQAQTLGLLVFGINKLLVAGSDSSVVCG